MLSLFVESHSDYVRNIVHETKYSCTCCESNVQTTIRSTKTFSKRTRYLKLTILFLIEKFHTHTSGNLIVLNGEANSVTSLFSKDLLTHLCITFQCIQVSILYLRLHYIANRVVSAKFEVIERRYSKMFAKHFLVGVKVFEMIL